MSIVMTPDELRALADNADGCALTLVDNSVSRDSYDDTISCEAIADGGSPPFKLTVVSSASSYEVLYVRRENV